MIKLEKNLSIYKREEYIPCFTFELLPRIQIGNEPRLAYVYMSWLFFTFGIVWTKDIKMDYDVQGNTNYIRKGFRYYLTFGLYAK